MADWIYISNQNIHALVFAIPPRGSFKHSETYRTIFRADEIMIVLEGQFALANPQTGEVQLGKPGDALLFRKDTWHHGFNLGQETVRVLEFFAPPPLQGTSGAYAHTKPYLPRGEWIYSPGNALNGFPFSSGLTTRTLIRLREDDLLWELRGEDHKVLIGYMMFTENILAGRIYLPPGTLTKREQHPGDEFIFVESGMMFVSLPNFERMNWVELHENDGFYIPAGTDHVYHNPTAQPGRALFAIAPNHHQLQE